MSKEFKIGLFSVISGVLLYYGFNFLRGSDLLKSSNKFYAKYTNITGLNASNPVYFNGLSVGRVSGFELRQSEGYIIVSLEINENLVIGEDAFATLSNDGLFGEKAIILDVGKSDIKIKPGDTLATRMDGGMLSQFEPVADNLNTTITKLNELLDELNRTDIKGTVDTLKYSIGTITSKINNLEVDSVIVSTNLLLKSAKSRSDQLEGVLISSKSLIDSFKMLPLKEALVKMNGSLAYVDNLLLAIQSDEGTVGRLINSDSVYHNLNKLLFNVNELIVHFNNYPKDFIKPLGRKNKQMKGVSQKKN